MDPTIMKSSPLIRFALSLFVLAMLSSCGSEFRQKWNHAGQVGAVGPKPMPVNGKWEGTWLSATNGHHGKLQCVVYGPVFGSTEGNCEFFYRATWKSILSGSYKSMHLVQKEGGVHVFKGDHQMPDWAGGKYHYEGTIQGDDFKACYECEKDRGTFTMKRVR